MSENKISKRRNNIFLHVLVVLMAMIVGYFLNPIFNIKTGVGTAHPIREQGGPYDYISPLLAYETPGEMTEQSKELESKINKYIDSNTNKNDVISVYYRDLNTGNWIGINDENKYSPASMLKVIIMIGYLKKAENNLSLLSSQFTYTSDFKKALDDKPFDSDTKLKIGFQYKISDLIDKMIIDSDNGAKDLLFSSIGDVFLNDVYTDLGLRGPDGTTEYTISPRDYSLFFRVLYNATYLDRGMSEKALSILSKATYANGIRSGVPEEIQIAHKFGERVEGEGENIKYIEQHDCGIVYAPNKPYFLCVMTHGGDVPQLEKYIQNISNIVYTQVTSSKP